MLGDRIAYLRRRTGMSQGELAARLGVTPAALGAYEQGRRAPAAAMLVGLSEVFDVSIDYLLTGEPVTNRDLAAAARHSLSDFVTENPREVMILRLLTELLKP